MREIKYRAKVIAGYEICPPDRWVYGLPMTDTVGNYYFVYNDELWSVDPETIGQYTGVCDRHGREIYEDDIVKKRTYNGSYALIVTFSSGCFNCGYGGGSSTPSHPYMLRDSQIEVIGNKYDNPELIGRKL